MHINILRACASCSQSSHLSFSTLSQTTDSSSIRALETTKLATKEADEQLRKCRNVSLQLPPHTDIFVLSLLLAGLAVAFIRRSSRKSYPAAGAVVAITITHTQVHNKANFHKSIQYRSLFILVSTAVFRLKQIFLSSPE